MKRIVGILLAGILCLGLFAGCGEKMSEEEKAYKEACQNLTYEQIMELDSELVGVKLTGEIVEHRVDSAGEPYIYIKCENGKEAQIRAEKLDQYKDGKKITVWGIKIGETNRGEGNYTIMPTLQAKYIGETK